jgi:hypothetical protein
MEALEEEEEEEEEEVGEVEGAEAEVGVDGGLGAEVGLVLLCGSPSAALSAACAVPSMTNPATVVTGRGGPFGFTGTTGAATASLDEASDEATDEPDASLSPDSATVIGLLISVVVTGGAVDLVLTGSKYS